MTTPAADRAFTGASLPEAYQTYLVPLIFEFYAQDAARRLAERAPARILETCAGTGVVTRELVSHLPETSIVATDLNQAMLDRAAATGTARPVEWKAANALELPFEDSSFDAVICQFGAMFFPDRPKAFAEARRVLRPGGVFIFSVWDRLETNEFASLVTKAMAQLFPEKPPQFLARTPYGYHEPSIIARDVTNAGFASPKIETLPARSRASSPRHPATGFVEGTPVRNEVESAGGVLSEATGVAEAAIARAFGSGAVDASMQAHVIVVER